MENYINYIFQSIINDVNFLSNAFDNYQNCTWIFVWIFWIFWIWLKYLLLTFPIWVTFRMIFSSINLNKYLPKK